MLNISKEKEDNKLVLRLEGKLDTVTSNDLEKELMDSVEGVEDLLFDCEKLEYISSAGLRVLLAAQKIMNKQGTMKVSHVCEQIMDIFEMTGFSEILTIVNDGECCCEGAEKTEEEKEE